MFSFLVWCWLLAAIPGQTAAPLASRIQEKTLADLSGLPNYTCTETVDRSRRQSPAQSFTPTDRLRLETAVVNGYELFGWPGEERIYQRDITRMVPGFIGGGDFAMHLRDIFTRPAEDFVAAGEEVREGRRTLRYDYRVPVEDSGWRVRGSTQEVFPVGYHGSFWVDKGSLELTEVNFVAEDVPRVLGFADFSKVIKYKRARIGSSEFLLPELVRMSTADLNGEERLNEARFHDCRQYTAESVIRFGPAENVEQSRGEDKPVSAVPLPDDFEITALLETAIDSDTAAIGDQISARVQQAIRVKGATVVPKNSVLQGRIVRLEVVGRRRYLDFVLTHFDVDGRRIDVSKRRNKVELETRDMPSHQVNSTTPAYIKVPLPIPADGMRLRLPQGSKFFVNSRAR